MRKFKRLTMTLALLIAAVGGAWAGEEPQLLTTINASSSFLTGSQTFDDIATVTFGGAGTIAFNDKNGWVQDEFQKESTVTVTAVDGYTITSIKIYSADPNNATISTSPFTAYLNCWGATYVTTGSGGAGDYIGDELVRIEVYGYKSAPTEWSLTPDADKKVWTLDKMPASDVLLQVEYEPTKVTMATNDKTMGTVEVSGESKVEWTADTWKGWTSSTKEYTVDDITMTSSENATIREEISQDEYNNSLFFFVRKQSNTSTVTFSTTGAPFSRIEFTMIGDYSDWNPSILPIDNWTIEGKSAVWEGEATKSLTLQSCSTNVSKITFFQGAVPDGVTVNTDGTFTVAKTATVTLKATPAEGYKFKCWEDDPTNTNPVREVTIEFGLADKTYKAVFEEILYNVTFADGIEDADKWKAEPNAAAKNTEIKVTYSGTKKVIDVKVEKKAAVDPAKAYLKWDADQKKLVATEMPAEVTTVANSNENVSWQAGTYVVDGEVNISGTITLSGDVNLIIKDGAKLTAQRISGAYKNLSIYGQAIQTGQLVVDNSGNDAIYGITTLEVHSAKVTATSSGSNRGGFFNIGTINVYGGSVDATATGDGYGISLNGSMDIYGGEVKAVGKGTSSKSYGFMSGSSSSTVTVYGGKLWAENADDKALKYINLEKGAGFTGKIETSDDNQSWDEYTDAETPTNKYVRVGY